MESVQTRVESQTEQKGKLRRVLGVAFGIAVAMGGTIGVGILRTPRTVAAQLGTPKLIVAAWILGGTYALLGANSIAELAASLPNAGGWYVYARRSFGDYIGFTIGWLDWLGSCAALALVAITIGEYTTALAIVLSSSVKAIAIVVLVFFSLLHLIGVRAGSGIQQLLSLLTALAFIAIVIACFVFGGKNPNAVSPQTALNLPSAAMALFISVLLALQAIIFTYDGWYGPIYIAEEFSNPARDLPRSMFGSVLSIICIYVLVNLALLYVLPVPEIAASNLPVADATQIIFGGHSGQVITGLALISLLGLTNAVIMGVPRILFGLSRDGLFPSKVTFVNRGGTPAVALLLSTLVAILLVVSGTFERLLAMSAFFYVTIYTTGFVSLFVLRKREPELPRPFKAWGYPWTTLIVLVGSMIFLFSAVISDTTNSIYAVLLIAIGYPIYFLIKRFSSQRAR
jgi:APA family basic amino acid/polyamine antiporter